MEASSRWGTCGTAAEHSMRAGGDVHELPALRGWQLVPASINSTPGPCLLAEEPSTPWDNASGAGTDPKAGNPAD